MPNSSSYVDFEGIIFGYDSKLPVFNIDSGVLYAHNNCLLL